MYLSDVQTTEIASVALKLNSLPTDIFCFFVYLTPAESKIQEEQENEHKAWEKKKWVFVNIFGEKEVPPHVNTMPLKLLILFLGCD